MAANQPFGKNTKPTSYDGLTIAQRQKAKRYAALKAAGKKNQDERRYGKLVQEVRRMSIWKHLGESNLAPEITGRHQ
jgi:hypothetical protein